MKKYLTIGIVLAATAFVAAGAAGYYGKYNKTVQTTIEKVTNSLDANGNSALKK